MEWDVRYCEAVELWLNALDKRQLKSIAKELRLVELCGNTLKLPHSKPLGAGLFELRERCYGLRIYYTFLKAKLSCYYGQAISQAKSEISKKQSAY